MSDTTTAPGPPVAEGKGLSKDARAVLRAAAIILVSLTLFSAAYAHSWKGWIAGSLTAFGAFSVGTVTGFLFGIPRASADNSNAGQGGGPAFVTNSNLVEISDWLTKILVGLGLVELGRASHGIAGLIHSVRNGLGGGATSTLVAAGLLLVGAIGGFMCSYLLTIMKGPGLFRRAALAGLEELANQVKSDVAEARAIRADVATTAADLQARQLANAQLDTQSPAVMVPELADALRAASPQVRQQIGVLAAQQRRFNRASPDRQDAHDRTVAVFQALVEADPDSFDNHAQLGFSLGDQRSPDYAVALSELDCAIGLRGPATNPTDYFFELARARTRIALATHPPSERDKSLIAADLQAAADGNPKIAQIVQGDPSLSSWIAPPN